MAHASTMITVVAALVMLTPRASHRVIKHHAVHMINVLHVPLSGGHAGSSVPKSCSCS